MVIPFLLSGRFRTQTHILCSSICKGKNLSVSYISVPVIGYVTSVFELINQTYKVREISNTLSHLNEQKPIASAQ